jgi:hypothetical protein|nr:MAG TPA: homing endonuclease [Caudoviricetes sp.]DAO10461.1 MAG TPA: homing endonuclease [Caudoviricetes sp.]
MDKLILNAKPLLGFDKDYRVTENGDIISMDYRRSGKPKKLAPQRNVHGYAIIKLMKGGKDITYRVHRLVAMAFVPNPEKLPCINHKDENKLNNNPNNLEWCDNRYNNNYGTRNKRISKSVTKVWELRKQII